MTVFRTLTAAATAVLVMTGAAYARPDGAYIVTDVTHDARDSAQVDYFLKIGGIPGDSKASGRKGKIEVLGWSWGETDDAAGEAPKNGPGRVVLTIRAGDHSHRLARFHREQTRLPAVELVADKRSDAEYVKITMQNVVISSYQTGGSSGNAAQETITLNYSKIEWTR